MTNSIVTRLHEEAQAREARRLRDRHRRLWRIVRDAAPSEPRLIDMHSPDVGRVVAVARRHAEAIAANETYTSTLMRMVSDLDEVEPLMADLTRLVALWLLEQHGSASAAVKTQTVERELNAVLDGQRRAEEEATAARKQAEQAWKQAATEHAHAADVNRVRLQFQREHPELAALLAAADDEADTGGKKNSNSTKSTPKTE